MDNEAVKAPLFSNNDVREMLGGDFGTALTDAEAGTVGTAIEGGIAAFMLINYLVFNPVKEEMDQIFSPLAN